jgi:hypothetical protein
MVVLVAARCSHGATGPVERNVLSWTTHVGKLDIIALSVLGRILLCPGCAVFEGRHDGELHAEATNDGVTLSARCEKESSFAFIIPIHRC